MNMQKKLEKKCGKSDMRIMIDTNVLISIIFFPSTQMNEFIIKVSQKHDIVLCSHIIDELKNVTKRKFTHKLKSLDDFLIELPYELVYTPTFIEKDRFPSIRDAHDYPILATAIIEDVDILITGDKDFSDIDIERPEIMTVSEFFAKY